MDEPRKLNTVSGVLADPTWVRSLSRRYRPLALISAHVHVRGARRSLEDRARGIFRLCRVLVPSLFRRQILLSGLVDFGARL